MLQHIVNQVLDELPPGVTILNDMPLLEKDFAPAGKGLTDRVVNALEAPQEVNARVPTLPKRRLCRPDYVGQRQRRCVSRGTAQIRVGY
jgi:hypothetical protein